MKINNIFTAAFAAFILLTGCTTEETINHLSEITVSQSYLGVELKGGSAQMKLTATDAWQIVPEDPEGSSWLTVSPTSGAAGADQVITFSADETSSDRNAVLNIVVGEKKQIIMFKQASADNKLVISTVKDIEAAADGKIYFAKGTVTNISNTIYGNWYLKDETGSLMIYGTLDKNGATKNFASLGLAEGDKVLISGPKTTYNGVVELVNVTVLSIEKSLLSVSPSYVYCEKNAAADTTISVSCSDGGFSIKAADDWVSVTGIAAAGSDKYTVTLSLAANEDYQPRTTKLTVTHTNSDVTPVEVTVKQNGLEPNPVTISEAKAMEKGTYVTVKGMVKAIGVDSYVIEDESGSLLIYKGDVTKVKLGYTMKVVGAMGAYNKGAQISSPAFESRESKGDVKYGTPLVIDKSNADVLLNGEVAECKYVQMKATLSVSNNKYYNLAIDGAVAIGSVYSLTDDQKATLNALDGKSITLEGYFVSISSSKGTPKYLNILMTSAK